MNRPLSSLMLASGLLAAGNALADGPLLALDAGLTSAPAAASSPQPGPSSGASLETVEREHIRATLEGAQWVIDGPAGAARILDLHPNTLRSRMKKLGLSRPARPNGPPPTPPQPHAAP